MNSHSENVKYANCNLNTNQSSLENYYINNSPTYCIFYQGMMVAYRVGVSAGKNDFASWVYNSAVPLNLKEEPVVETKAKIYYMFADSPGSFGRTLGNTTERIISEILLLPYDFTLNGTEKCDGATLPIQRSQGLYYMIGSGSALTLPDLSDTVPGENLNYYITTDGIFPDYDETSPEKIDNIKYYAHDFPLEDYMVGDIKLADFKAATDYAGTLLLCDGRELPIDRYYVLFSLIGNKFGGDGKKTFRLPNLMDESPIPGAFYFIVCNGAYPFGQ